VAALTVVVFCFKDVLFSVVLAPKDADFVTFRAVRSLAACVQPYAHGLVDSSSVGGFESLRLINVGLASQFLVHMRTSFYFALLIASPFVLYVLFCFISPALYKAERRVVSLLVSSGFVMFMLGALVAYFVIIPFTVSFLGSYQVSGEVPNFIALDSYIDTFFLLLLLMGVVFELPVLSWLLAKAGLLKASFMKRYRRHAFVAILVVAAVVTPTSDILTLSLVSVPVFALYEFSVFVVGRLEKKARA
jgi:sec-independent protein translocase protein TatC